MSAVPAFLPRFARWVAACLVAHAAVASAAVDERTCEATRVRVFAALAQDASDACAGARDALDFFEAEGLKTDVSIEIRVRDFLPPEVDRSAAGCFLQNEGRILIRPYARFRENRTWFDVPIDRRLYRSLAAHEVAHALGACNFSIAAPSIEAKEYVAYVAMFSSMDPALRAQILAAVPEPSGKAVRLTAMLYMFDPMRFGVASYRHHRDPDNGSGYLKKVLAGEALSD